MFIAVASQLGKMQIGEIPPYTLTVVKNPVPPTVQVQECRRRLHALIKATFPDGQIPDPYASVWVRKFGGDANKDLPFVQASLVITADVDDAQEQRFLDVWCLWDMGAQVLQILSSQLNADV